MLSQKPWRPEAVIQFCAAVFACFCSGMVAIELLRKSGASGFQDLNSGGAIMVVTLCFQGVTWIFALVFLRLHRVRWSDALGLNGPQLKRALGQAALALAVILPMAILLQNISIGLLEKLGWKTSDQPAVTLFKTLESNWLRAYMGLFAVVIAPVAEEFIFRGMLYPVIKQLGFPRLALFGVSLLFAAIHLDVATFMPLFALALCLTWLYEKTDNLLAPIAAHALFNGFNLIVLLYMQSRAVPAPQ